MEEDERERIEWNTFFNSVDSVMLLRIWSHVGRTYAKMCLLSTVLFD